MLLNNLYINTHAKMTGSLDWTRLDRPLNTISFESLSHTNTILQGLNELRRQEHLLDITLLAEGQSFKVIKIKINLKLMVFFDSVFLVLYTIVAIYNSVSKHCI